MQNDNNWRAIGLMLGLMALYLAVIIGLALPFVYDTPAGRTMLIRFTAIDACLFLPAGLIWLRNKRRGAQGLSESDAVTGGATLFYGAMLLLFALGALGMLLGNLSQLFSPSSAEMILSVGFWFKTIIYGLISFAFLGSVFNMFRNS